MNNIFGRQVDDIFTQSNSTNCKIKHIVSRINVILYIVSTKSYIVVENLHDGTTATWETNKLEEIKSSTETLTQ